jgi:gamma-glutamyltranspeptidase/glutathione hydrolase
MTILSTKSHVRRLALAAIALALLAPVALTATKNPEVVADHGMVASAHALASQAGIEILKAGGNAVDAAVATAFAIGVVEPNATGIGGEGMMVIYLAGRKAAVAIDYRSAAPAKASFKDRIASAGYQAVAVPGTVAGLTMALEKYGTMKLPRVMAPAVMLAADGYAIGPTLASVIADGFEEIAKVEGLAKILCPNGLPLEAGGVLKNPDLAESLRKIAAGGRDVFYRGELAGRIADDMAANGGFITRDDLASYKAIERVPVRGSYRGYDLLAAPPPVGGLGLVEMLQILENFDVARYTAASPTRVHLFAEAMQRGFADFTRYVGDPAFVTVPVDRLSSKAYAKVRAAEIKPDQISPAIGAGAPSTESASTTSLSVVDKAGNMVALTQTLSGFFGARVAVAGIILNNEMGNFQTPAAIAPGKRMVTTISPTIVLKDGKAFATLGTPGAMRIMTTMTLIISNLVDYRMGIQEAIEAPRFFPSPKTLLVEPRFPEETVTSLAKMGYTVKPMREYDLFFGGAQGIVIDQKTGKRVGGADPRRDGAVIGY